jgi:hypothetical protein
LQRLNKGELLLSIDASLMSTQNTPKKVKLGEETLLLKHIFHQLFTSMKKSSSENELNKI